MTIPEGIIGMIIAGGIGLLIGIILGVVFGYSPLAQTLIPNTPNCNITSGIKP